MPLPPPASQQLPDAPRTARWLPDRFATFEVVLGLILLSVAAGWSWA